MSRKKSRRLKPAFFIYGFKNGRWFSIQVENTLAKAISYVAFILDDYEYFVISNAAGEILNKITGKYVKPVTVIEEKKRVLSRKKVAKVTKLEKKKKEVDLEPKKRKQIIRVTERRKFSTRLDFSKAATYPEKLKYLIKKIHDGMILRFVIKAPKGKGSPTKRAKKTGKVIRRSPYISTGWINFGHLTPERIEYYLTQLGGVDRIERIFYMPKR